jgi:hypothetical protein
MKHHFFPLIGLTAFGLACGGPELEGRLASSQSALGSASYLNMAVGKQASQSSTAFGGEASRAVDGNTDGSWSIGSVTHTGFDNQAWWEVDLKAISWIQTIRVWGRTDPCCIDRLSNFYVLVSDVPFQSLDLNGVNGVLAQSGVSAYYFASLSGGLVVDADVRRSGRYVRVQLVGQNYLSLAEVFVNGLPNEAIDRYARKSSTWAPLVGDAQLATDGNVDGKFFDGSVSHTRLDQYAWWEVDLGNCSGGATYDGALPRPSFCVATQSGVQFIDRISIRNRTDCCSDRLSNFFVFIKDTPFTTSIPSDTINEPGVTWFPVLGPAGAQKDLAIGTSGRFIRIQLSGTQYLALAEVLVFANRSIIF